MKKIVKTLLLALAMPLAAQAQGWPSSYDGVMLQGFYWDSFKDTRWVKLQKQAPDFNGYFSLVWLPQSGKTNGSLSMGYDPYYFFNQNSSFGTADELRSLIKTFRTNNIGAIADVVINHHQTNGWWSFPRETHGTKTYQLQTTDIVANDDAHNAGYTTAAQAQRDGITLSSNNDEGEDFSGMRDLDHKSANVQRIVKAYEHSLVNDLGYVGFRYDMVKGFAGSHVGNYNDAAGVSFSVGECWDNSGTITNWINATGKRSAAFDFQFKYVVNNAANTGNWGNLGQHNPQGDMPLINNNAYRRYAVTFVENHDTQLRADGSSNGPLQRDTLAANAYMLAMPGTPCVFYRHYQAYPDQIKAMIDARKAAGITNTSDYSPYRSTAAYYGCIVNGTKADLLVLVGSGYSEPAANRFVKVLSGHHYAYYLSPSAETPFADKPSGSYAQSFSTMLTAVSATAGARLVYTLDGSTPTASSPQAKSGTRIAINRVEGSTVTLKVGLLIAGSVSHVVTRTYAFPAAEQVNFETPAAGYTWNAYFIAPASWDVDTDVYAWAWTPTTSNYTPDDNATWPGDNEHVYRIGRTANGRYIWQWCYYGTKTSAPKFIIFNNGQSGVGSNQTHDMTFTNGGWYDMTTTAANPALGIDHVTAPSASGAGADYYTLDGTRVSKPVQKGIYIHKGRKVIVR
ncbi:MAG: alpha-amylase family glycosyl hydrolase [Prevotella sp.]